MVLIVKEEACNVPKGAAYVHLSQCRASSVALYWLGKDTCRPCSLLEVAKNRTESFDRDWGTPQMINFRSGAGIELSRARWDWKWAYVLRRRLIRYIYISSIYRCSGVSKVNPVYCKTRVKSNFTRLRDAKSLLYIDRRARRILDRLIYWENGTDRKKICWSWWLNIYKEFGRVKGESCTRQNTC
jgi:hypothetical protein